MNNSPINSTINSTTVVELADASSLSYSVIPIFYRVHFKLSMYGVRNLDMSIRFSLKSRPSEGFPRPEMSQIKAEISLHTNLKLIFHKNVGWQGYQWIP